MNKDRPLRITHILFFLVIILPRLFLLSAGPFNYDTLDYIICGSKTLETFRLQYAHGAGYPLAVVISAFAQAIFGSFGIDPVGSVLIAGAILGALAVFSFYLFVYAVFGNVKISLFASFLFSFLSVFFSITTHGRIDHALECIFVLLSFYFLVKEDVNYFKKYFISSLLLGLAIASRFSAAIFVLIWALWYIFWDLHPKKIFHIKRILTIILGLTIPLLAFYWPALAQSGLNIITGTMKDPNQAVGWAGLFSPLAILGLKWELEMITFLGLFLILVGSYFLIKEDKKKLYMLISWFLISFLYLSNIRATRPRYLILSSLPLFIIEAYALYKMYSIKKYLSYILLVALIFLQMYPIVPLLLSRHKYNLQKEFASYVSNIIEDNSIILAKDEWIFLEYYMKDKKKTITSFPSTCNREEMDNFLNKLDSWLQEGKSVYIIKTGFGYDSCRLFLDGAKDRYKIVLAGEHINEDWYSSNVVDKGLFMEKVFKLLPRPKR